MRMCQICKQIMPVLQPADRISFPKGKNHPKFTHGSCEFKKAFSQPSSVERSLHQRLYKAQHHAR